MQVDIGIGRCFRLLFPAVNVDFCFARPRGNEKLQSKVGFLRGGKAELNTSVRREMACLFQNKLFFVPMHFRGHIQVNPQSRIVAIINTCIQGRKSFYRSTVATAEIVFPEIGFLPGRTQGQVINTSSRFRALQGHYSVVKGVHVHVGINRIELPGKKSGTELLGIVRDAGFRNFPGHSIAKLPGRSPVFCQKRGISGHVGARAAARTVCIYMRFHQPIPKMNHSIVVFFFFSDSITLSIAIHQRYMGIGVQPRQYVFVFR